MRIKVDYVINGTTCIDRFTALAVMYMMAGPNSNTGTVLRMDSGEDELGNKVKYVAYRQAEMIKVWEE